MSMVVTSWDKPQFCSECGGFIISDITFGKINVYTGNHLEYLKCERADSGGKHDKWEQDPFEQDNKWKLYR